MDLRVTAYGHSHLSAYLHAKRSLEAAGALPGVALSLVRLNLPELLPGIEYRDGEAVLSEAVTRRIRFTLRRDQPEAILSVNMGNEYNIIAMHAHPEPFDFHWPEMDLPADKSRTVLPFDLIKAELAVLANRNTLLYVRFLAENFAGPILLVPPPPPIGDDDHIRANPGVFANNIAAYGLNPPEVRLKVYLLYCQILREAATGRVIYYDLPHQIAEGGYLKKGLWYSDPTHANGEYGEILLPRLIDRARREVARAAAPQTSGATP
jgi:hypothetical protein